MRHVYNGTDFINYVLCEKCTTKLFVRPVLYFVRNDKIKDVQSITYSIDSFEWNSYWFLSGILQLLSNALTLLNEIGIDLYLNIKLLILTASSLLEAMKAFNVYSNQAFGMLALLCSVCIKVWVHLQPFPPKLPKQLSLCSCTFVKKSWRSTPKGYRLKYPSWWNLWGGMCIFLFTSQTNNHLFYHESRKNIQSILSLNYRQPWAVLQSNQPSINQSFFRSKLHYWHRFHK